jgi:hypothetical protein
MPVFAYQPLARFEDTVIGCSQTITCEDIKCFLLRSGMKLYNSGGFGIEVELYKLYMTGRSVFVSED